MSRSVRISEVIVAAVTITIGLSIWLGTLGIPEALIEGQVSAKFWPRVIASGIMFLGLVLSVQALTGHIVPPQTEPVNPNQRRPLAISLGILAAYLAVWPLAGFLPATVVAFLLLARTLGLKEWRKAALWSALLTLVVWGLFGLVLEVPI